MKRIALLIMYTFPLIIHSMEQEEKFLKQIATFNYYKVSPATATSDRDSFIAKKGKKEVASITFKKLDMTAKIFTLFVEFEFRKKGIGTQLIKLLIDEVKNKKCQQISLNADDDAIDYYKKLGFILVEQNKSKKINLMQLQLNIDK